MRWLLRYALFDPVCIERTEDLFSLGMRDPHTLKLCPAARFENWRTRRELHPQPSRRQRGALLIELRIQKWLAEPKLETHRGVGERYGPPSLRSGEAASLSLRFERWLVGSAGNAPVRRFRFCFATPDLQAGNRITSLAN